MTPLYTLRVPKSMFVFDSTLLLLVDLAAIVFTAFHLIGDLGLLALLAVELIILFFILDLFLWIFFGLEKIYIEGDRLIVENRRRLLGRVRSVALRDIEEIEIDSQDHLFISSLPSRFRYMLHRGNIILHNADGTRLRLCMSTDPTTLKALSSAIQQAIPKQPNTIDQEA